MVSKSPSIYIPFMDISCTEEYIANIFKALLIGDVCKVDLVKKSGEIPHYMAFIHFNYWYNNTAANNLREKIENEQSGRIVYNDPQYWIIYKNKNPISSSILEEKLECAMMLIENLQERIKLLERVAPLTKPTLSRS